MSNNTVSQFSHLIPKTTQSLEPKTLSNCVEILGHALIQRHLFTCSDSTVANCCSKQASLESWDDLNKQLQEPQLNQLPDNHPLGTFRTKANCLRVCCSRPIMVVYPDGVWYRQANLEVRRADHPKTLNRHHGG